MDLTGVLANATDDFILIASFLVTVMAAFWGIKFALGLLNNDGGNTSESHFTYSSGHLNDSDYLDWLRTKEGISNDIGNSRNRYDEPYDYYISHD